MRSQEVVTEDRMVFAFHGGLETVKVVVRAKPWIRRGEAGVGLLVDQEG